MMTGTRSEGFQDSMSSSVGDEVRTVTSEDFGFKKLGQASILPSYNEKLPFASLQNLDISNEKGIYIAASGGKVVIGDLQSLRDFIQNQKNTTISFQWEKQLENVMLVKFLSGTEALIVCKNGTVYTVNCTNFESFSETSSFAKPLLQVDVLESGELLAITTENQLVSTGIRNASGVREFASGVVSFDLLGNRIYSLLSNNSIQTQRLAGDQLEGLSTLETPSELKEEFGNQYRPLLIKVLNEGQFLIIYGEEVPESSEDVMYDHKMFIVDLGSGDPTFSESFDITPAFGSVLRYPTSYNLRLNNLIGNDKTICVLASACSSEVTVWDSAEVVQPTQDSERAVLPISKETDNDTNPVGMALDISTTGTISEPCQGVDSVEALPLIYILNNEGSLQIVGLYHSSAIKSGNFIIPKAVKAQSVPGETTDEGVGNLTTSGETPADIPPQSEKAINIATNAHSGNESLVTVGTSDDQQAETGTAFNSESSEPAFGKTSFGLLSLGNANENKTKFGTPSFGKAGDKPLFGSSSFGMSESKSTFGSLSQGNTDKKPTFGSLSLGNADNKPTFGQSPFGKTDNKATFGSTSFGNADGKPLLGTSSFGTSGSKPASGSLPIGNSHSNSPFGAAFSRDPGQRPSFGSLSNTTADKSSTFGTPSFGKTDDKSVFGSPAFGSPAFGAQGFGSARPQTDTTDNKPVFGTPLFGNADSKSVFSPSAEGASQSKSPFGSIESSKGSESEGKEAKPAFGTVSFGSGAKSPFSGLSSGSNTTGPFEQQKSAFSNSSFSKFAGQNPFTSSSSSQSPFAHLTSNTGKSSPLQFDLSSNTKATAASGGDGEILRSPNLNEESPESSEDQDSTEESDETEGNEPDNVTEAGAIPVSESDLLYEDRSESEVSDRQNSESLIEKKNGTDTELSDSTVEQTTMSQLQLAAKKDDNKSSISAITARIKEGAKMSTSDLKFTNFENQTSSHSPSPFTAFTGDLKKASSPGFSFATISISDHKSERPSSEESSRNEAKETEFNSSKVASSAEETYSKEKEPYVRENPFLTTLSGNKDNSTVENATKEDVSSDTPDSLPDHESDNDDFQENPHGQGSTSKIDKEVLPSDKGLIQEMKKSSTMDHSGSEKNHSHPDSSGEESYDALDDVSPEELKEAMNRDKSKQEVASPNTSDKATSVEIEKSVEYVSQGIQTFKAANSATQTEDPLFSDIGINSFEDDESYCALQNMPEPLPQYFTSANITPIKYSSQDPTMRLIEKTYQVLSSELEVWQENAENMQKFLADQSTSHLSHRTLASLPNIYTWRISESQRLQDILSERSAFSKACTRNIKELQGRLSSSLEAANEAEAELASVKNDYYQCETANTNPRLAGLKHHQLEMQSELRRKMLNSAEKLNHIEKMLQILKLFTVESEQIGNNAYVHKLARDLADRDNLCNEIARLREQLNELIPKDWPASESTSSSKECTFDTHKVQSIPVAELSLKLSTKMQIGALLRKR